MADTLAPIGTRTAAALPSLVSPANANSNSHFPRRKALAWIKRRARRLQTFFVVSRREALSAAALDWADLNPASAL